MASGGALLRALAAVTVDRRRRPRSNRCGGGGNGGYSWNIILSYCARVDEPRRRLPQMEDVVQRMRAVGVTPDCYSYTSLVAVCLASHAHAASRDAKLEQLLRQMDDDGVRPDATLLNTLLGGYARTLQYER